MSTTVEHDNMWLFLGCETSAQPEDIHVRLLHRCGCGLLISKNVFILDAESFCHFHDLLAVCDSGVEISQCIAPLDFSQLRVF